MPTRAQLRRAATAGGRALGQCGVVSLAVLKASGIVIYPLVAMGFCFSGRDPYAIALERHEDRLLELGLAGFSVRSRH